MGMYSEGLIEVCRLTPDQEKAFNKLKKAYKDCEKAGIYFANCYGNLTAFDRKKVSDYGDDSMPPDGVMKVRLVYGSPAECMKVANEWSDDTHTIGLTKKGAKIYEEEER